MYRRRHTSSESKETQEVDIPDYEEFLQDWHSLRERHKGQLEILDLFFNQNMHRIFLRMGRKGAKTCTIIDIAWRFSYSTPNMITYICYPTLEQGYDVLWEESRLQNCDIQDPWMREKYVKSIEKGGLSITFLNGSKIKVVGTWTEKRGRGMQPNLLIADEVKDCNAEYLDAAEPNLAAKPDSRFILAGTPPKKRNHYHLWEDRTTRLFNGKVVKYSSYVNTALPHLKEWLDKKHEELKEAGKEDEFIREYLAEDCFSSEDRMLPDPKIMETDKMIRLTSSLREEARTYIIALLIQETKICALWCCIERRKDKGDLFYMLDYKVESRLWEHSFESFFAQIPEICHKNAIKSLQKCHKIAWDEKNAFIQVIPDFSSCQDRKGNRWFESGIFLLRETMNTEKIIFSEKVAPIGLECQNFLRGDNVNEFPLMSCCAMIVNDYFCKYNLKETSKELTDAELIRKKLNLGSFQKKGDSFVSWNWR